MLLYHDNYGNLDCTKMIIMWIVSLQMAFGKDLDERSMDFFRCHEPIISCGYIYTVLPAFAFVCLLVCGVLLLDTCVYATDINLFVLLCTFLS